LPSCKTLIENPKRLENTQKCGVVPLIEAKILFVYPDRVQNPVRVNKKIVAKSGYRAGKVRKRVGAN
jgi:hypothetical protein